jgi:hypothetical protein
MVARSSHDAALGLKGGVAAGLFAGLVLSLFMLFLNLISGTDVWQGMKGAGAPFLGERAAQPGFDFFAVWVGLFCHFLVSVAWRLIFGVLAYGLSKRNTILFGAAFGIVVWLGMYYVLLPLVGMGQVAVSTPIGMAVLTHVLFGAMLGIGFIPFQREVPYDRQARFTRAGAHP